MRTVVLDKAIYWFQYWKEKRSSRRKGDKVGKDLFNLFNNALFRKTIENLRNRINFEVVTSRKILLKRIAKPKYKRTKMFRKNLVGIHMTKPLFVEYRPIQVGFANLNLSKYLICDFHYNTWMHKFPNSTLLFSDTASLACEVVAHNLYTGIEEIKDEFDFSEFPEDHLQSFGNRK